MTDKLVPWSPPRAPSIKIERAIESEKAPVAFPVHHIMTGDPPEAPAEHVRGLLLDRDINLWIGSGGSSTSTLFLHLAACIATNTAVFGSLGVVRPGRVLMLLPEDGEGVARSMLDAILASLPLEGGERDLLDDRLLIVPDDVIVDLSRDAERIGRTARDHGAVLVIADPLRNLIGGLDENDAGAAGPTFDALRRAVCREAGATLLARHHTRKPGREALNDAAPSAHDARGSGGWVNAARLVFNVTKRQDRITLTAVKANRVRADMRHELVLQIKADPENAARWLSCKITDANIGSVSQSLTPGIGRQLNPNEQAALTCLDDQHEEGKRLSWSRWRDDSGLKAETFRSVKDRLLAAKIAKAIPTGKTAKNGSPEYAYSITPAGKSALNSGWVNV